MSSITPVEYKSTFNPLELTYVKIAQDFEDGTTKTAKLPVYDGSHGGLETLFYVILRFERAALNQLYMSSDALNLIPDYSLFFFEVSTGSGWPGIDLLD